MLRTLVLVPQLLLLLLPLYDAVVAWWGWSVPRPAPRGPRRRRFRVVIPAHDEEAVIGPLLEDLQRQDVPRAARHIVVLADRCTDATAELARRHGAHVAEREEGPDGKAAALRWYLTREPLRNDEALVVVDADNRVPPDLLARFADELDAGHEVLQAYLDVANPDDSLMATASALTYWAGNRTVQLARRNLGFSADLGGTGMCLSASALQRAGGFGDSLTEDQELTAKLLLADVHVVWLHDLRIRDEKPADMAVAVRQRGRWAAGRRQVRKQYLGPLLRRALRGSGASLDYALRLLSPGRSFLALLTAVMAVAAAVAPGGWLLPWQLWAAAAAIQVLLPMVFLAREGVGAGYLLRYPAVTLLALLWLPIRLVSRRMGTAWFHTPHGRGGAKT